MIKLYKDKYDITTNDFFDVDIIQWWKWVYYETPNREKLKNIPRPLYKDKDLIKKLCKYVIEEEMGLKTRYEISQITTKQMRDYKISFDNFEDIAFSPYKLLQFCYPDYNYKQFELKHVPNNYWTSKSNWFQAITFVLDDNLLSLNDVLNGRVNEIIYSKFSGALISTYFGSIIDMWIWYYKKHNTPLDYMDFSIRPQGYWSDKHNIIREVKNYCENICEESIIDILDSKCSYELVDWIQRYFTTYKMIEYKLHSIKGYTELFNLLTLAYPQIISDKLLFQWDFTGCKKWSSKQYRIQALKDLVLCRLNIDDLKNDIPKAINRANLKVLGYDKFVVIRDRYYKNSTNFYEWAIESFPEFKYIWTIEDFGGVHLAFDGAKCNSNEERLLYEFIKTNISPNIISIGYQRKGKYTYKLPDDSIDSVYCPDFVIENNDKPIVIEYFGMYNYSNNFDFAIEYNKKTHRKNIFYNSRNDIVYTDIYSSDLKNNFQGVINKIIPLLRKRV